MSEDNKEQVASLRAVAHPVRLRILSLLTGTAMSAAEVARELGISHANASYHLRVLAEAGQLVPAGEEKVRGGVAKRYRHPWEHLREGGRSGSTGGPSREDEQAHIRAFADELVRRFPARRQGRGLLTDAEVWMPPEAWARAVDLLHEVSRLVHAEARPPRAPGTVHVAMTAAAFEIGDMR